MKKSLSICAALLLITSSSYASEAGDKAAGIGCIKVKKIVKKAKVFADLRAEKLDTVNTIPSLQIIVSEGKTPPDRLFFRDKDGTETEFTLGYEGYVDAFEKIASFDKKGSMCFQSKAKAAAPDEKVGFNFSVDFNVFYNNGSGLHTLAELEDGLKDGKTHYKKLFGGPMSVMVPKLTHIGVANFDTEVAIAAEPLSIFAMKNGAQVDGLIVEEFAGLSVVSIAQLQTLGAEGLSVKGGVYKLMPIPSIKKMKKLGFGDEGDD